MTTKQARTYAATAMIISTIGLRSTVAHAETWHETNLSGNFNKTYLPAADYRSNNGFIDLYAVNSDNTVSVNFAGWIAWTGWTSLGSPQVASNLSAVSAFPNHSEVFAKGTDGYLYHQTIWDTTPYGWASMNSPLMCSAPSAVSWGQGRMDVFIAGCDYHLWHRWYDNTLGGWGPWEDRGVTNTYSTPSAVAYASGKLDVFVRTADAPGGISFQLVDKRWDGQSWSDDYLDLMSIFSGPNGDPSGASLGNGAAGFIRSTSNSLGGRQHVNGTWYDAQWSNVNSTQAVHAVYRNSGSPYRVFAFWRDALAGSVKYLPWMLGLPGGFVGSPQATPAVNVASDPIPLGVNSALYVFAILNNGNMMVQSFW